MLLERLEQQNTQNNWEGENQVATTKEKKLMYKEKPLQRKDNLIYYGNEEDDYIIMLQIEKTKNLDDLEISGKINVVLQTNEAPGREKVIKKAERNGLYEALDLGSFWLEDVLENGV